MERQFINCAVLFTVLWCQILFVHSRLDAPQTTQKSPIVAFKNNPQLIGLSGIVNVRKYVKFNCGTICNEVYGKHSPVYTVTNKSLVEEDINSIYCLNGEWILNWNLDDLGEQFGNTNCSFRTHSPSCDYKCTPCICVAPNSMYPVLNYDAVNSFSLHPRESASRNNRVVTGFGFSLMRNTNIIQLRIQQAELMKNGSIDRGTKEENNEFQSQSTVLIGRNNSAANSIGSEYGKDFISFSYKTRTMFLDEIFVPDEYVVTGVRFVEIDPSELHSGIKLQVKGTRYDSSFRLVEGSEVWFDYSDGINQNFSYNLTRREIPLDNCTEPNSMQNKIEIRDTHRFVRFRATDMVKDLERNVIPFISDESAEVGDNSPLRGVGLSYIGQEGVGGYIIPKVFRHQSLIYTPDGKLKPKTGSATRNYCQFVVLAVLSLVILLK